MQKKIVKNYTNFFRTLFLELFVRYNRSNRF